MKTHLVVHCSGTKDGRTVSWDAIRRWHVEHNGWRAIGYHYGVELVGSHYELLAGRTLLDQAAGEPRQGMNRRGVHVCFVGDYDQEPPPLGMLQYAAPHLADLCEALDIPLNRLHVLGHREIAGVRKTCPGELFNVDQLVQLMVGA